MEEPTKLWNLFLQTGDPETWLRYRSAVDLNDRSVPCL